MHADGSVELYELTRNELIRSKIARYTLRLQSFLTGTVFESAFGR